MNSCAPEGSKVLFGLHWFKRHCFVVLQRSCFCRLIFIPHSSSIWILLLRGHRGLELGHSFPAVLQPSIMGISWMLGVKKYRTRSLDGPFAWIISRKNTIYYMYSSYRYTSWFGVIVDSPLKGNFSYPVQYI